MVVGVVFLLGCAAVGTMWHGCGGLTGNRTTGAPETPPWPRSPWKNARLNVKYVGNAACARCHAEIADSFRRHPMGRSLAPITSAPTPGGEKQPGISTTFEAGRLQYSIELREGREFHKERQRDGEGRVIAEVEAEIKYALGSGTRGISYLLEHDGRLLQSPIAWYSQKKKWDLSPHYQQRNLHFDREIEPQCLFCHANRVSPVGLTVNRYKEPIFDGYAIGCERCHGPGELHVHGQELVEDRDVTIVNPLHLEPALREAVCEQCHLQGDFRMERAGREPFDYRPGLPLSSFIAVFERANKNDNKAVGHVEQMHTSRCFRGSEGQLGCVSCHDPHTVPATAERGAYFRQKCLACHEHKPCSMPEPKRLARSSDDACAVCHMPTSANSDIVHNATTDHRILRSYQVQGVERPGPIAAGLPLVLFHEDQLALTERKLMSREMAAWLTMEARRLQDPPRTVRLAKVALDFLDHALSRWPGDLVALRYKAQALVLVGRPRDGMNLYDALLKIAPEYEQALNERVYLAIELDDPQGALAPALQAAKLNPWSAEVHERLAFLELRTQNWDGAFRAASETLRLNPFLVDARKFLIQALLRREDTRRAGEELKTLIELNPTAHDELRLWFSRQIRARGRG